MKYTVLIFLSLLLFASDRKKGDFVKDISIEELKVSFPVIKKDSLDSNTKILSIHSDRFPIVYLDINFYSGEKEASKVAVEIPSLLSEVLRLGGSKNFPEEIFSEKIENMGARLNISSDFDKLKIELSYLSKDEKKILEILKDFIKNPNFTEKLLENAKKKAIESISRRNERTESIGFRKAKELFYRNSNASLIPQIESIQKITLQDLKKFWDLSVNEKEKSILVNGNFNKDFLFSELSVMLPKSRVEKNSEEKTDTNSLIKDLVAFSKKSILVEKKVNQSMILMIGVLPPHNDKDFYAIQILDYILGGGGFNSYLMQKIRVAKGLAYSSTSYPVFKKSHGILYAYTLTKNESSVEVCELMKEILSEKTFNEIKEDEIENAKQSIVNQFVFMFTNDNAILENQLRFDEDQMPENYLLNYRDELKKVSLADIRRVGKKYFAHEKLKNIIVSDETILKKFQKESFVKITPEEKIGQ
jgi:zinc protease